MGEDTKIEWADSTVNFWWGCTKVSPVCTHCYAETWAKRTGLGWGAGAERRKIKSAVALCHKLNEKAKADGKVRRVFTNSMSDFLDAEIPAEWRAEAIETIRACPWLLFLLLTKRPENADAMLPDLVNVALGATVEGQEWAEKRIQHLIRNRPRVAFVFLSMEPLLEAVDLLRVGVEEWDVLHGWKPHAGPEGANTDRVDWVIVGGESGHGARPMHPDWARAVRDQCVTAGVPFHFKQWGAIDEHGQRVGKKVAGRLLDGRTWDGFPEQARKADAAWEAERARWEK